MIMQQHRGLTLIELLMVIAILAILLTLGVPGMSGYLEKSRLRSAAETMASTFYYARSETIVQPANDVFVSFHLADETSNWCFGISRAGECDCRLTDINNNNACYLKSANDERILQVTHASEYPGITLVAASFSGNDYTNFDPVRGTASGGHVIFKQHQALKVMLSPLGRARICSPADAYLSGYPEC